MTSTVTDHRSLYKAPTVCKVCEVTTFQRARSDEQREQRRRAILSTAAAMLAEMPVAELSLNELSRRVGLAKSNVLRYFETREAVLLELYDTAWTAWLDRLDAVLPPASADGDARARYERVAASLTASLVADPLVCELISVSASVLERNVSPRGGPAPQARVDREHRTDGRTAPLVAARAIPRRRMARGRRHPTSR